MFEKHTDRWMHRVVIIDGGSAIPMLRSVEGDEQLGWPPSPPLQDVNLHELPAGAAVLGVGMAGSNHWSASFSIESAEDDRAGCQAYILADIACFCKQARPESATVLKSSYLIEPGIEIVEVGPDRLVLRPSQYAVSLTPLDGEHWNSQLSCDGSRFMITPERVNEDLGKPTRWGYRVAVLPSSKGRIEL